jgi:uncharacterized UBP type Zn finger protein
MPNTEPVVLDSPCQHVAAVKIHEVAKPTPGCEECLAKGARWVHLRECLTCGHVGCCDSSPGKHATAHFTRTGHPIVVSAEPGETWSYCYVDERNVGA